MKRQIAVYFCLLTLVAGLTGCGIFGGDEDSAETTPAPDGSTPVVDNPATAAPATWDELETWLTANWNNATDPAAVRAALTAAGWQTDYSDWHAGDFNGDLRDEWVLLLYGPDAAETTLGKSGNVWVVNGSGVVYQLSDEDSAESGSVLKIFGIEDMTGDNLPELVIESQFCGASTCNGAYRIMSLVSGTFTDLVNNLGMEEGQPANVIEMSFPEAWLTDASGDGLSDLVVHGGGQGSVGAGVVREATEVWAYDGSYVTLASVVADPAIYNHHLLYEANDLLANGDLDGATTLYETVINDRAYQSPPAQYPPEQIYTDVSEFAAFRLILLDLLKGDPTRAASRLEWLQTTYPDSAEAQAAQQLVANWTGDPQAACAQIDEFLTQYPDATGSLADLGYANPSLTANDICP